jgi:hypothetical protein
MDDGDGNLICLGILPPVYGRVYVRDGGDIYFLTNTFTDFISGLRFWEELFPEKLVDGGNAKRGASAP